MTTSPITSSPGHGSPNADLDPVTTAVEDSVGPDDITDTPSVNLGPSVNEAQKVGEHDAASEPFDQHSHDPRLPAQFTIVAIALLLGVAIGKRAKQILAAYEDRSLTPPMPAVQERTGWRSMSWLTRSLIVLIAVFEMWLGATLWEKLTHASDQVSWLIGLCWSLAFTFAIIKIAEWISEHSPGLVANHGLGLGIGASVMFVGLIAAYAFALAGGAKSRTGGGISGGGISGTTPTAVTGVNWVFLAVYLGAMLFFGLVLLISHVHDLGVEKQRVAREARAAHETLLNDEQQRQLAIHLLQACLDLADQLETMVHAVTRAYVTGARRVLPPSMSSRWNSDDIEDCAVPEPDWVPTIKATLDRLRKEASPTPITLKRIG